MLCCQSVFRDWLGRGNGVQSATWGTHTETGRLSVHLTQQVEEALQVRGGHSH